MFDSRVKAFIAQPKTITYDLYQAGHEYTADFFADLYLSRPTFFEIKPKGYEKNEEEEDKFDEIERTFDEMGFDFVLVTADHIEDGCRLNNFKRLRRFLKRVPDDKNLHVIENIICQVDGQSLSLKELIDEMIKRLGVAESYALMVTYQCLANKKIGFDVLAEELNGSTMIGVWDESFNRTWNAVPIQE